MEEEQQGIDPTDFIIYVCGDITMQLGVLVTQQLLALDMQNKMYNTSLPISMIINSGGGDVSAAWQIIEIMDFIDTAVYTTALGQMASAALMIFMNGELGFRVATDRTSIMSHRYSWGTDGSHPNLISIGEEFNNIFERITTHYEECTGLDKETIHNNLLCEHDVWLTANQAKKYGIVDHVKRSKKGKTLAAKRKAKKDKK